MQLLEAEVQHFKAEVVGLQALTQQLQSRNPDIERVISATQQRERALQEQRNTKTLQVTNASTDDPHCLQHMSDHHISPINILPSNVQVKIYCWVL